MKKRMFAALALGLVATGAMAQFTGPSSAGRAATVAEAGNVRLDTVVTLTGNIVNHIRDDYYTFRDGTGEMRVEIERDVWRGREVTPETKVRITGEVERGFRWRYIDVDVLDVL